MITTLKSSNNIILSQAGRFVSIRLIKDEKTLASGIEVEELLMMLDYKELQKNLDAYISEKKERLLREEENLKRTEQRRDERIAELTKEGNTRDEINRDFTVDSAVMIWIPRHKEKIAEYEKQIERAKALSEIYLSLERIKEL